MGSAAPGVSPWIKYSPLLLGLVGAVHAAWLCGPILWVADSLIWRQPPGDMGVGMIGAEAFLKDQWRWPLAVTRRLLSDGQPISIAYTDSLPVLMIMLKALGADPAIASPFAILILVGQVLQPVAAGWALRRAGINHWAVLLPGALLVAWMPLWYYRLLGQHLPLTWHWQILVALGLAIGWCRSGRLGRSEIVGAILLCAVSVATHVYLAVEVLAVCLAGSLVLLRHGKYLPAAAFGLALIAAALGMAIAIGLLPPPDAGVTMGRFASPPGHYGFNLLAPFDFWYSALWPSALRIEGSGGHHEGMAYLGLGVFLLLGLVALVMARRGLAARRARPGASVVVGAGTPGTFWPLAVALLGLAAFAVFPNVWLGQHKLISLPVPPPLDLVLEQLRSGGRMMWPAIYALVIAAVAYVGSRVDARVAGLAVSAALALQLADTAALREHTREMLHAMVVPPSGLSALRAAGPLNGDVRLRPSWFCVPPGDHQLVQAVALDVIRRGGTIQQPPLARAALNDCDPTRIATDQPLPNVTDVIFRAALPGRDVVTLYRRRLCDPIGPVLVCKGLRTTDVPSEDEAFLALTPKRSGLGVRQPVTMGQPAAQWLYAGWSGAEPWGTWTEGAKATLMIPLPTSGVVRAVTLEMTAYAGGASRTQGLRITHAGKLLWQGRLPAGKTSAIQVPVDSTTSDVLQLDLQIEHPQSPKDNGLSADARLLGIALMAITLDPER